jgi:hypothetical protein
MVSRFALPDPILLDSLMTGASFPSTGRLLTLRRSLRYCPAAAAPKDHRPPGFMPNWSGVAGCQALCKAGPSLFPHRQLRRL